MCRRFRPHNGVGAESPVHGAQEDRTDKGKTMAGTMTTTRARTAKKATAKRPATKRAPSRATAKKATAQLVTSKSAPSTAAARKSAPPARPEPEPVAEVEPGRYAMVFAVLGNPDVLVEGEIAPVETKAGNIHMVLVLAVADAEDAGARGAEPGEVAALVKRLKDVDQD